MKHLCIRHQQTVADPLQSERLLKALKIILGSSVFAVGTPRCCGYRHGCYRVSA